jgi:hypothetical protein
MQSNRNRQNDDHMSTGQAGHIKHNECCSVSTHSNVLRTRFSSLINMQFTLQTLLLFPLLVSTTPLTSPKPNLATDALLPRDNRCYLNSDALINDPQGCDYNPFSGERKFAVTGAHRFGVSCTAYGRDFRVSAWEGFDRGSDMKRYLRRELRSGTTFLGGTAGFGPAGRSWAVNVSLVACVYVDKDADD